MFRGTQSDPKANSPLEAVKIEGDEYRLVALYFIERLLLFLEAQFGCRRIGWRVGIFYSEQIRSWINLASEAFFVPAIRHLAYVLPHYFRCFHGD